MQNTPSDKAGDAAQGLARSGRRYYIPILIQSKCILDNDLDSRPISCENTWQTTADTRSAQVQLEAWRQQACRRFSMSNSIFEKLAQNEPGQGQHEKITHNPSAKG